jgi:anaerobic selenocysteine-containing dehydrogenase
MFKHQYGWEASRAISCLPALTGQLGIAGGGLGQRHGASPESTGFADVLADVTPTMPAEAAIPSHMPSITEAMARGRLDALLTLH